MAMAMITGVQIIGILFSLAMMYLTFVHSKRQAFGKSETTGWLLLWVALILALLFPNTFNIFTERLGIARAFDLFTVVGFIIVLSMSFHNYVVTSRLRKKLETTVREKALQDSKQSP